MDFCRKKEREKVEREWWGKRERRLRDENTKNVCTITNEMKKREDLCVSYTTH